MNIHSCKAKGRRACLELAELLLKYCPDLKPDDIRVTSSSACGEDILLSPKAREIYPYAIEVKNVEKLNVWKAYEQARTHLKQTPERIVPILAFKRNRSDMLVCLNVEDFLWLTR